MFFVLSESALKTSNLWNSAVHRWLLLGLQPGFFPYTIFLNQLFTEILELSCFLWEYLYRYKLSITHCISCGSFLNIIWKFSFCVSRFSSWKMEVQCTVFQGIPEVHCSIHLNVQVNHLVFMGWQATDQKSAEIQAPPLFLQECPSTPVGVEERAHRVITSAAEDAWSHLWKWLDLSVYYIKNAV